MAEGSFTVRLEAYRSEFYIDCNILVFIAMWNSLLKIKLYFLITSTNGTDFLFQHMVVNCQYWIVGICVGHLIQTKDHTYVFPAQLNK